jgi:hypothetical protein
VGFHVVLFLDLQQAHSQNGSGSSGDADDQSERTLSHNALLRSHSTRKK